MQIPKSILKSDKIVEEMSSKYQLSGYQLMDFFGITYSNGKYLFQEKSYKKYSEALQFAHTVFLESKKVNLQSGDIETVKITPEEEGWRTKINKKRLIFIVLALSYVPLGAIIHTVTKSDEITFPIIIMHFIAIGCVGISITKSKCPRCQNSFFYTKWFKNHFANKCLHCGFKIIE